MIYLFLHKLIPNINSQIHTVKTSTAQITKTNRYNNTTKTPQIHPFGKNKLPLKGFESHHLLLFRFH